MNINKISKAYFSSMNEKSGINAEKKVIEIKKLRPWVKIASGSIVGLLCYTMIRTFIYKPKPYVI